MADAVTSQTLVDGHQTAVFKFTNISDGSGESAVKKVDVSALATNVRGEACTRATIEKIWWQWTSRLHIFWWINKSSKFRCNW